MNISRIAKYVFLSGMAYLAWQWAGVFFVLCLFFWRKGWEIKRGLSQKINETLEKISKDFRIPSQEKE